MPSVVIPTTRKLTPLCPLSVPLYVYTRVLPPLGVQDYCRDNFSVVDCSSPSSEGHRQARSETTSDNPRFLILPWIRIPNLGSHILLVRPPATAERLNRALQHHPRADRDLRRNPSLHRRSLQGLGLDPRRNHPGPRPLRQAHQARPAPPKALAKGSQPVISWPSSSGERTKTRKPQPRHTSTLVAAHPPRHYWRSTSLH